MPQSATTHFRFARPTSLPLAARFDGGRRTSDGGLPWLEKAAAVLGRWSALAGVLPEWRRRASAVRHALETLVRQRVCQLACGYEAQHDANTLRPAPRLKVVCGRLPETGADRASQPTCARRENAVRPTTCSRLALALALALGQGSRQERARLARDRGEPGGAPRRIRLDLDGPDDPTHGDQEGSAYHGYSRQQMDSRWTSRCWSATATRPNASRPWCGPAMPTAATAWWRSSSGSCGPAGRAGRTCRLTCGDLRAARGVAGPARYDYCAAAGIGYPSGLVPTPRLAALATPLLAAAQRHQALHGEPVRRAGEAPYQAGSGPHARRVVDTAETLAEGPTTRFVVTPRSAPPLALYDWSVAWAVAWAVDRGEPEGWRKDCKRAGNGDRLSDHRVVATQCRRILHAAAYGRLDTLRRWRLAAGLERRHLDTRRLRLRKIGDRVRELLTRVRRHLASSHPATPLWHALAAGLHRS